MDESMCFHLTGKFDSRAAMVALTKGLQILVLVIEDLGPGGYPDLPGDQEELAFGLGLPSAESYRFVRDAGVRLGWLQVAVGDEENGQHSIVALTEAGRRRAAHFRQFLRPESDADEAAA